MDRLFKHPRCALAPLDDGDPVSVEDLLQAQKLQLLGASDPVEIDVVEGKAPRVFGHDRKGRARDLFGYTERARDPFRQRRLPGAEWAGKGYNAPCPKAFAELHAKVYHRLRGSDRVFFRAHKRKS